MDKDLRDGRIENHGGIPVVVTEAKPESASDDKAMTHLQLLLANKTKELEGHIEESNEVIKSLQAEIRRYVQASSESIKKEKKIVIRLLQRVMSLYDIEIRDLQA